jgi:G3E family GTPase
VVTPLHRRKEEILLSFFYFRFMKLFLIGGFLGSGKTTAIVNACQHLITKDQRVAVITNDQGDQQVDNAFVKSFGIPASEVANGCFCCNYDQFDNQIHSFIKTIQPDIIFAESVGSCTDLIATVAKPFIRHVPGVSIVISVFADAALLLSLFEGRLNFINENVQYIYKKQLEEADLLVVNKIDLMPYSELKTLNKYLAKEFPVKKILYQNSLAGNDIQKWTNTLCQFQQPADRSSLELDYDRYGDGEAQLAWLDQSVTILSSQKNAVEIAKEIISSIDDHIKQQNLVTGHLKFFIETSEWKKKISITTTMPLSLNELEQADAREVRMLINARVQTEPSVLQKIVNDTLKLIARTRNCKIMVEKWSVFKPDYPKPIHRIS